MAENMAKSQTVMHTTHGPTGQPLAGHAQPVAGSVVVCRLWPGLYSEERFELPAGQAEAAIAAGHVFPVPDGGPVAGGSLVAMIRSRLEGDPELTGLLVTTAKYAGRTRNVGLTRCVASLLPRQLRPSHFTPERFRAEHGERPEAGWYDNPPQWSAGVRDPRALCLAHHLRRRRDELLVNVFAEVRDGRLEATGFVGATGARTFIAADLWSSAAVTLDLRDSALVAGNVTLFAAVEVEPVLSKPAPAISAASVEAFVVAFAGALLAAGRRFSARELALAAENEAIGASARAVTDTLRRLKPTAWARRGRRSAVQIPTPIEIADAARQAREAVNRR